MADGTVGQQVTQRFRTSVAGESFTITNATKPDGTSWTGPTITHLGSGNYQATGTQTLDGVYLATITGNTSGRPISLSWDILAGPTQTFTRHTDGTVIFASHVNELQVAIEGLSH